MLLKKTGNGALRFANARAFFQNARQHASACKPHCSPPPNSYGATK